MSFVDKLRMRNIYPSAGLGPPDMDSSFNNTFDKIMPYLQQNRMDDFNERNNHLQPAPAPPALNGIASNVAQQPKNVVFNDITPYQKGTLEFKNKELAEKTSLGRDKLGVMDQNADDKLAVSQQRANIYEFKAKNPNLKFEISKGGNFVALNPLTGEAQDTGISSGTMSDAEKLNITGKQHIAEIDERGSNANSTQKLRNEGSLAQIAARVQGEKDVNAAKPTHGELPTQTRVRQNNAARELANTRPELAKFITTNPDGSISITPPNPSAWFDGNKGPTPEQHKEINQIIFGNTSSGNAPINKDTKPVTQPATTGDKVMVQDKSGKKFNLPASQLDEAIKQGYTKVGG